MAVVKVNDVAGDNIGKVKDVAAASIGKLSDVAASLGAASYSIVWLAVGDDGRGATSTDGQNWTEGQIGHSNSTDHRDVAFGNTGSYDEGCWVIAKGSNTMEALWTFNKTPIVATNSSASWESENFAGSRGARAVVYDEYNTRFLWGAKGLSGAKTIPTASMAELASTSHRLMDSASYSDYSDGSSNYGNFYQGNMASDGAGNIMVGIKDDDVILGQYDGHAYNWVTVSGSNFLGTNQNLQAIAHGNGVWIVAGEGGKMKRTPDGGTWSDIATPSSNQVNSIAFGGAGDSTANVWMAVGGSGQIDRSTDQGASWTELNKEHTVQLNAIASDGSGSWVAVGNSGQFGYSSDDGASWAFATASFTGNWFGIAINRMLPHDAG